MSELSPRASALLADLAADHGLDGLAPDADGLVPIALGDTTVALAFSAAWDSVFLTAVLAPDTGPIAADPYRALAVAGRDLARRRTRLAVEPKTGALVAVAEIALAGLAYADFARALDRFAADVAALAADLAVPVPRPAGPARPEGETLLRA